MRQLEVSRMKIPSVQHYMWFIVVQIPSLKFNSLLFLPMFFMSWKSVELMKRVQFIQRCHGPDSSKVHGIRGGDTVAHCESAGRTAFQAVIVIVI